MKSKLIKYPSLKDVVEIKKPELKKDPISKDVFIEKEYNDIINSKSGLIDADKDSEIAKGVIATINVKSDISMFNKQRVDLNVGLNYYDEVLEDALIGMKIGGKKTISINDKNVDIEVINIRNIVTCEITLDVLKEIDKDIASREEFEDKIYNKYVEKFKLKITSRLAFASLNYVVENSEFELDEEELKIMENTVIRDTFGDLNNKTDRYVNHRKGFVKELYKRNNLKFTDMTDDEYIKIIKEEMGIRAVKYTFSKLYAVELGFTYTEEDYNKKVAEICKNYNKEEEEVKSNYPYDMFKDGALMDVVNKFAEAYFEIIK